MAEVAAPGRLAITLPVEPSLRVRRAPMRWVGALLAVAITLRVARPIAPAPRLGGLARPSSSPLPPSLRRKLLSDARASSSVPFTERRSLDNSRLTLACARTACRNCTALCPSSNRSRFPVKLEWSRAASVHTESHQPAERQIKLHRRHPLTLGADAVESLAATWHDASVPEEAGGDPTDADGALQTRRPMPKALRALSPESLASGWSPRTRASKATYENSDPESSSRPRLTGSLDNRTTEAILIVTALAIFILAAMDLLNGLPTGLGDDRAMPAGSQVSGAASMAAPGCFTGNGTGPRRRTGVARIATAGRPARHGHARSDPVGCRRPAAL